MEIDVIVPAFNAERFVRETLGGILAQDMLSRSHGMQLRVLVVDDGSTDATSRIAKAYGPQVVVGRTDRVGNVEARNVALRRSSAEFVAFCDADDVWNPAKLSSQMGSFDDPGVVASCTALQQVDAAGRLLTVKGTRWNEDTVRDLLQDRFVMPVPLSSWVVRRDGLGQLDSTLPVGADLELASRLVRRGRIHYVPEPMIQYRIHSGSISSARTREQQLVRRYLSLRYEGGTDTSFSAWRHSYRPTRKDRRVDAAVHHYRSAGQSIGEGRRLAASAHLAASAALHPSELFRKVTALRGASPARRNKTEGNDNAPGSPLS